MTELQRSTPVIDAHHHLWRYNAVEFGWIDERMLKLRRDFAFKELAGEMEAAGVQYTVAVQARQALEETRMLLAAALRQRRIAGVVGWVPLADPAGLEVALSGIGDDPLLVGARHVVQGEAAGFLEGEPFSRGIGKLTELDLAYDLLVRADQMEETIRFVDRHPKQRFVLDHMAKPRIGEGLLEPWVSHVSELAKREHVCCKVSGMVTEADWQCWNSATLRPFLDTVVAAFGTGRLLAGSDWPVCLVASGYAQWWSTLRAYFAEFSASERSAVFGENAVSTYRLKVEDVRSEPGD